MRTDVKIGLAVGLVLLLIVVVYFSGQETKVTKRPEGIAAGPTTQPAPAIGSVKLKSGRTAKITHAAPPKSKARSRVLPPARPVVIPKSAQAKVATITPTAPVKPLGNSRTTQPAIRFRHAVPPAKIAAPTARREPIAPIITASPARQGSSTRRTRSYVVQAGDKGFWGVAQNVYGHGKHWPRIRQANPEVDSNALPVGKRLIIPPLPSRAATTPPARPKAVPTKSVNGQRTYIVRAGDNGFWGVAKNVYGDGKYYLLIRKANPEVNSQKLRPGQRLVVPPLSSLPAKTSSPARTPAKRTGLLAAEDGRPMFD